MEKTAAIAMFEIFARYLQWDNSGLSSYNEFKSLKNKIINNDTLTYFEKQTAYNYVQSVRYFFNSEVDKPRNNGSFKFEAYEFGL